MTNQNRHPAGVPVGGQFATSAHTEAEVSLAQSDAVAALGDLTQDQQRLLGVLLNPKHDNEGFFDTEDPAEMAEEYEESFGSYLGADAYYDAQRVADMLHSHYNYGDDGDWAQRPNPDGAGDFAFGFESNAEGEVGGYHVGCYLGHESAAYLTEFHDTKYLANGDRDATGLKAALNYATVLDDDYQRILAKARKAGLLPDPDRDPGDPVTRARQALAAYDAVPEGEDVDVDTMAQMRDALAALTGPSVPAQQPRPRSLDEATTLLAETERESRQAAARKEDAAVTTAAFLVREQYPEAQYLVIANSEDESWNCYAHAVLDANRKPIAYPEDTFAEARTQRLQQTVMDLPRGGTSAVPSEPWNDDGDDDSYVIDLANALSEEPR